MVLRLAARLAAVPRRAVPGPAPWRGALRPAVRVVRAVTAAIPVPTGRRPQKPPGAAAASPRPAGRRARAPLRAASATAARATGCARGAERQGVAPSPPPREGGRRTDGLATGNITGMKGGPGPARRNARLAPTRRARARLTDGTTSKSVESDGTARECDASDGGRRPWRVAGAEPRGAGDALPVQRANPLEPRERRCSSRVVGRQRVGRQRQTKGAWPAMVMRARWLVGSVGILPDCAASGDGAGRFDRDQSVKGERRVRLGAANPRGHGEIGQDGLDQNGDQRHPDAPRPPTGDRPRCAVFGCLDRPTPSARHP